MEKFTPLAKILHCRRHWRDGQIPPLYPNIGNPMRFSCWKHWSVRLQLAASFNKSFCPKQSYNIFWAFILGQRFREWQWKTWNQFLLYFLPLANLGCEMSVFLIFLTWVKNIANHIKLIMPYALSTKALREACHQSKWKSKMA